MQLSLLIWVTVKDHLSQSDINFIPLFNLEHLFMCTDKGSSFEDTHVYGCEIMLDAFTASCLVDCSSVPPASSSFTSWFWATPNSLTSFSVGWWGWGVELVFFHAMCVSGLQLQYITTTFYFFSCHPSYFSHVKWFIATVTLINFILNECKSVWKCVFSKCLPRKVERNLLWITETNGFPPLLAWGLAWFIIVLFFLFCFF